MHTFLTPQHRYFVVAGNEQAHALLDRQNIFSKRGHTLVRPTAGFRLIDSALPRPGRFDVLVPVGLPDQQDCLAILHVALRERPLELGLDVASLAPLCLGLSGAEIVARVDEAALRAIWRALEAPGADACINAQDFQAAFGRGKVATTGSNSIQCLLQPESSLQ